MRSNGTFLLKKTGLCYVILNKMQVSSDQNQMHWAINYSVRNMGTDWTKYVHTYVPIFKEDYNGTTIIPSDDLEFF